MFVTATLVYNAVPHGTEAAAFAVLAPGGGLVNVMKPSIDERGKDDEQGRRVVWVWGGPHEPEHRALGTGM